MSHWMLAEVAELKAAHADRVHFLLSNHELAELTDYPIVKGQKMLNLLFRCGMQESFGPATDEVREAQLAFLRTCPLAVRLPGGVFVCHSAPEQVDRFGFDAGIFDRPLTEGDLAHHGPVFNLFWGRDYRPQNAQAFAGLVDARVLIHGHDPCREGFKVPNDTQIILDCSNNPASYLLLPTGEELDHGQIVQRIQTVPVDTPAS